MNLRIKDKDIGVSSLVVDVLSILPMLVWGVTSVAAIVSYGSMQWFAPVACAAYSSALCAIATVQMWRKTHVRAAIYIVIEDSAPPPAKRKCCTATSSRICRLKRYASERDCVKGEGQG